MSSDPQPSVWPRPGGSWAAGTVTAQGMPPAVPPPVDDRPAPPDGPRRQRRQMLIFGGVAATIVAVGLVVILVMAFSGGDNPFRSRAAGPADLRPPLAQLCPAPTVAPSANAPAPPKPAAPRAGPRTVDQEAGISYAAYGAPWEPWQDVWRAGTLEVPYRTGQHFVTELYSGGSYHASILSAAVPAADNDAVSLNLDCVGRQVAADVRAEYYPQPNTMEPIKDETTTLGGRPAWLSVFRLHFDRAGLKAKDELSAVAVIDVGKPTAAVLYVSIPGTHKQFDWVIDDVLASVRPT
jgi:hypothetical protein